MESERKQMSTKKALAHQDAVARALRGNATDEDYQTQLRIGAEIYGFQLGRADRDRDPLLDDDIGKVI